MTLGGMTSWEKTYIIGPLAFIIGPLAGKTQHHISTTSKILNTLSRKNKPIKVSSDETILSYDVCFLFTCISPEVAVEVVRKRLDKDISYRKRTKLTAEQICDLLSLCLNTTYFLCRGTYYKQNHGCAMGSPVSSIVVNLYMEEFEQLALSSYPGEKPSHWYRYVDDT